MLCNRNVGAIQTIVLAVAFGCPFSIRINAAPGDWPEPRQNPHLTAIQPLAGAMKEAPVLLGRIAAHAQRPAITPVQSPDGKETWGLCVVGGVLRCFNTKGDELWNSHPPGLNFTSIIASEDFDNDGRMEIALKAGRPSEPYGAAALVSLEDGKLLWKYDVEPMSYAWYLHVDRFLPGKDSKQLIVLMQGYPPDKDNGYMVLFDFPQPGASPAPVWRYDFDAYTCYPSLMQVDLDGDGIEELAVETHSRMWFLDAATGTVKQFLEWDVSPGNSRSYGYIEFVDLNGDGLKDFLCIADFAQHHEVLLNENGLMKQAWHYGWAESVMTGKVVTTWPAPPYADVDGDGQFEIVVSMFNADRENHWMVRVYDAVSGEMKYTFPGAVAAVMGDSDGDGADEIGVNRSTDPTKTQFDGAQLLKVVAGKLCVVWEDAKAVFLSEDGNTTQTRHTKDRESTNTNTFTVRQDGRQYTVNFQKNNGYELHRKPLGSPKSGPDFSNIPAIEGGLFPIVLAADVTGDGQNEILLYLGTTLQVIHCKPDGMMSLVGEYQSSGLPCIADLNGDGKTEIITGQTQEDRTPTITARTPALNDRVLWESVFPPVDRKGLPWRGRPFYARAGRFTGKAVPDVYVWTGIPFVRSVVLNGESGAMVWEKGETGGSHYWGPTHNLMAVYDYNVDGKDELVFTNPDQYCVCDGPTGEFLYGPKWPSEIFKQPSLGLYTLPAILTRPDAPSLTALVSGHYFQGVMTVDAEPMWYALPTAGESRAAPEGFMQMESGEWLMGFGRQNGLFSCINVKDGSLRWEMDMQASCSDVCTLDVDGDGRYEFVFGTSHNRLVAVGDGNHAPRVVWDIAIPAGAGLPGYAYPAGYSAPIAADINGDGASEILVPAYDGAIYIYGANR